MIEIKVYVKEIKKAKGRGKGKPVYSAKIDPNWIDPSQDTNAAFIAACNNYGSGYFTCYMNGVIAFETEVQQKVFA